MTFQDKIKEIVMDSYTWGLWGVKITGDEPAVDKWTREALKSLSECDSDTLEALMDNMESIKQRRVQLQAEYERVFVASNEQDAQDLLNMDKADFVFISKEPIKFMTKESLKLKKILHDSETKDLVY